MSLSIDPGPVAIVGAACCLPGADGLEEYWNLLMEQRCQLSPLPDGTWDWAGYAALLPGHVRQPVLGAVLPPREVPLTRYRVPPSEERLVHRVEALLIELTERALADARQLDSAAVDRTRLGIVVGSMGLGLGSSRIFTLGTRFCHALAGVRQAPAFARLDEATRARVEQELSARFETQVANGAGVPADLAAWTASGIAVGRVCNALDLRGPHFSVDAGEASALAALEAAVRQLRHGDQDAVVVVAHAPALNPVLLHQLARMGWLGAGRTQPFDERAEGCIAAEGMGAVVLKRLGDALRDGDRIDGVIRGIAGTSQGRGRVAPTPDENAIADALKRAYEQAGYGLGAVDFIETHGAGHPDWDAAELSALRDCMGARRDRQLALGAGKALIGNQLAGAGLSGLLKVLLAMRHRTLPPELQVERPLEVLRGAEDLEFHAAPAPWLPRAEGQPLRAGVTALGMGGTHYHLTLESYVPGWHERLLAALPKPPPREHFGVAIVGMGTVLPGAASVPELWDALSEKRCEIRAIPRDRWRRREPASPGGDAQQPQRKRVIYLDKGGFVRGLPQLRLPGRLPRCQAASMDRSQRWMLESVRQAWREGPERTAVFIGHAPKCETEVAAEFRLLQTDLTRHVQAGLAAAGVGEPLSSEIATAAEAYALADLPESTEDTLPGYQGCFLAGRVAAAFGLSGPSMTVDSACASSLAALELGCRALMDGDCDRAVVGGTWSNLSPEYYAMFSMFQVLCKEDVQDPFGPTASGFIPGEGAGALMLKRLEDAVRDSDVIHAVVRAVAGSSDGKGKAAYAVNPTGLLNAVQRALSTADVPPDTVALVEAHAVGAPAGDLVELETYARTYGRGGPAALSFLKGNFGHLHTASGVAALIKTATALERGQVLPAAGFTRLHPDAALDGTKLHVATSTARWPAGMPRRAAVTSYGMGGTNYHAILDGPPPAPTSARHASGRSAARKPEELIAVVGAEAHFASGAGLDAYWEGALAGHSGIRELPADRWIAADYAREGYALTPRGGFLDPEALEFPWRKFRVPPLQARRMPPMDRLLFRVVHGALEQAGYGDASRLPRADTAIFVGSMGPMMDPTAPGLLGFRAHEVLKAVEAADAVRSLSAVRRDALIARVTKLLTPRQVPIAGDVSGSASIMAGRIANLLGLQGMHMGVDAEAASALAALDVAALGLLQGDFDVAIVAATSPWLSPLVFEAYGQLGVLSSDADRRSVSDPAGCHLGEGGGAVVLKRLSDARRDGDRILSVIRAIGSAHHGRGPSLTAPAPDTLVRSMDRALQQADWAPQSVGYLEWHVHGVAMWDDAQQDALARVFGQGPASGSAADAAGHTLAAAGMASFLRAVLSVERGQLPARVGGTAGLWASSGGARRAGVTAWGLNGSAYHVLLEEPAAASDYAPQPRPKRRPLDVALVGLGGVFPQAPDVPSLWSRVLERHSAIREIPADRWQPGPYFHPSPSVPGRIYSRLGAFVEQLPPDALDQLPPVARERADRSQLMAVAATREALRGTTLGVEPARVGVVLGEMDWRAAEVEPTLWLAFLGLRRPLRGALVECGLSPDEAAHAVRQMVGHFEQCHRPVTEDTLPGFLGSLEAGRVAREVDATGATFVVESTCASSLVSLHVAANLLRSGRCDVVLSGGMFANLTPEYYLANCSFRALSPNGIRPFDARADGFVPGEGAGVVVLKRLEDAEAGGDTIRAIIRGTGGSSDGGGSILAPNASSQALAVRRALEQASVLASSIRYVECHGAGTALGDITELAAYAEAYGERSVPLGLTSIKSMIGHLASAAGVAAVIKTALALRHGVLPPSLGFEQPNESPHLADGRFEVLTEPRPWDGFEPRRAGVSGFGLGGTNFHVVMEAHDGRPRGALEQPPARAESSSHTRVVEHPDPQPQEPGPVLEEPGGALHLAPGTIAALLIQGIRRELPGKRVRALERLRLVEPVLSDGAGRAHTTVEVRPPHERATELRVQARLMDRLSPGQVHASGEALLEPAGSAACAEPLDTLSAADLECAIAATAPSHTGEWELLEVERLAPTDEGPSIRCIRDGRQARVHAVSASPRARVENALWWSRPSRWRDDPFHEDGTLRHPSDFPFVDRRLSSGIDALETVRDLSLSREPYLSEHCVDGTPLVPGAVHAEALAEAAALLCPDAGLKEMRDFCVLLAVKLNTVAPLTLRTVVRGARPRVEARLLSDFVDPLGRTLAKDRLHARAECILGEALPPIAVADWGRVLPWLTRGGSSPSRGYEDPRSVGPRFWSIRWYRIFGRSEILACVEKPALQLLGHTLAPRFCLDPILLDACFQAATLLDIWRYGQSFLPAGFEVLRLHGRPDERKPLYVYARMLARSQKRTTYQIEAFDAQGRMFWHIHGYHNYTLFPIGEQDMATLNQDVALSYVEDGLRGAEAREQ